MKTRLSAADLRFIVFCGLLLGGCTWFSVKYFRTAFPEASIDFRVNRDQARGIAEAKLAAQGCKLDGYRQASSFDYDDDAKTFLEREVGLKEENRLLSGEIRLWRWSYRWFRPKQKEEFDAEVTPAGEWVGFEHEIPEDAPRPAVTDEKARALAEQFLKTRFGRDPATLDFVEMSSETRPKRVDREFTWKSRAFNVKDASYRFEVDMLGDEPGAYQEFLKVPEQWTRDYERLRSKNEVTSMVDVVAMVLLIAALVVVLVQRARRHDVRWKLALGIGGVVAALTLLAQLNAFPLREFAYPTTDSYSSFVVRFLLQALMSGIGAGSLIFIIAAGAEPVYREGMGSRLSLGGLCSFRGLRTRTFFLGSCFGISLAAAFLAYQIVFYRIANHFGAWAPAEVNYSDLLNTRFPWLFVLLGGLFPAVSEEFVFRMFAVPFLRKLVRSTAVAIVVAGFVWGFGHAGYPNQPFYIRGIEVGIVGVIMGCIMLRWGVLVGLVWHYSIDAAYTALLLMRSPSWYFRLSGAASAGLMLLPALIALVAYWRRGGFEPDEGARNQDQPAAAEIEAPAVAPPRLAAPYVSLSIGPRWAAIAILGAGILASQLPVSRLDSSPQFAIDGSRALSSADAFLRTQQIDPSKYRHFVFPGARPNAPAGKYFLDHGTVPAAAEHFARYFPLYHWTVRYYRPLDREEVSVTVHPETGAILEFSHALPEEQPGADLSEAEARKRAEGFVRSFGWDVAGMELKEHTSEKKPHRRDYQFTWEAKAGDKRNLAEAHFRLEAAVSGAIPAGFHTYWKIPDAYERARSAQTAFSISSLVARIAVGIGAATGIVWYLIYCTRQHRSFWRIALKVAIPTAVLASAAPLLAPDEILHGYQTSIPYESFEVMMGAGLLIGLIGTCVLMTAFAGLIFSAFPGAAAELAPENRRRLGFDAAFAIFAAFGFNFFHRWALAAYAQRFPARTLFQVSGSNLMGSAIPSLTAFLGSLPGTLGWLAVVTAFVLLAGWIRKRWLLVLIGLLVAAAGVPGSARTAGEFASSFAFGFAGLVWLAVFCRWFARRNILSYLLAGWALCLAPSVYELMGTAARAWHIQAWILIAVFAAVFIWIARPSGNSAPEAQFQG